VAGLLLERGWSGSSTYVLFALPLLVASAATFILDRMRRSERKSQRTP
jgi:hypothetical protein